MTKKRYFTISKKGRYGTEEPIFRFENLDGAMEMFKYLMNGKAIELERVGVPDNTQKPDKDNWVSDETLFIETKKEPEFHLGSEIVEVYTKEEADKISKEREAWLETFKKKGKK
jgi:hypothetical protein